MYSAKTMRRNRGFLPGWRGWQKRRRMGKAPMLEEARVKWINVLGHATRRGAGPWWLKKRKSWLRACGATTLKLHQAGLKNQSYLLVGYSLAIMIVWRSYRLTLLRRLVGWAAFTVVCIGIRFCLYWMIQLLEVLIWLRKCIINCRMEHTR